MNKKIKLLIVILITVFQFSFLTKIIAINVDSSKPKDGSPTSYLITDKGSIVVNRVDENDLLEAYKILDAYYSAQENTITYDFTSEFSAFLKSPSSGRFQNNFTVSDYLDITSESSQSSITVLDELMALYATYDKGNTGTQLSTSGTSAEANNLDVGAYFVYPKSTSKVYSVMVGNIEYKVNNGVWQLSNAVINAKASSVSINKYVDRIGTYESSHHVDQLYDNYVVLTIPKYPENSVNKKLLYEEYIDPNLFEFEGYSSIEIYDGDTKLNVNTDTGLVEDSNNNQVASITMKTRTRSVNGNTLSINFNADNILSDTVIISYKTKLKSSANMGPLGNKSTAELTYVDDVYSGSEKMIQSTSTVYTYKLQIDKKDEDTNDPLNGAKFELYSDQQLTQKVGQTIRITSNGTLTIDGIASGTYYLKEITAPIGYKLPIVAKEFNIDVTKDTTIVTISNVKASELPFTGGIGTVIYTLIGLVFVLIVSIIYIVYRKKKNKQ